MRTITAGINSFDLIVPTKNRPTDIACLFRSITCQTLLPNKIIIIDQSNDQSCKDIIFETMRAVTEQVVLDYVHSPEVTGLVLAKKIGLTRTNSDLIFFLDDDIELDENYFNEIVTAFQKNQQIIGCAGFIENAKSNYFWKFAFNVFHTGVFADKRPNIYTTPPINGVYVPSNKLPQGVSAWRRFVFNDVIFQPELGFHVVEDLWFSIMVENFYPSSQFILTTARAKHFHAPVGRLQKPRSFERKLGEFTALWKTIRSRKNDISFCWLMVGFAAEALFLSIKTRDIVFVRSFFRHLAN